MTDGKKCLNLKKYSVEQSSCISKLVQGRMKERKVKKSLAEKLVVISKSPNLMEDPNEVGHLNFTEMVMGIFPDNVRNEKDLDNVINHEIAHLIANDKAFPNFHQLIATKTIPNIIVEKNRPRHNHTWEKEK